MKSTVLLLTLVFLCAVSIGEAFYLFTQNWTYLFHTPIDIDTINIWDALLHVAMSIGSLVGLLAPIAVWIQLDTEGEMKKE